MTIDAMLMHIFLYWKAGRIDAKAIPSELAVALIVISVLLTAGCARVWSPEPVDKQVKLPGIWTAVRESYPGTPPADGKLPLISLRADGTAKVAEPPIGSLGKRDSYMCFKPSDEPYTGPATWEAQDGGLLRLKHGKMTTVFWAGNGLFGSLDWESIYLAECGHNPMIGFAGPPYRTD